MASSYSSPRGKRAHSYASSPNFGLFRNYGHVAERLSEIVDVINFEDWTQFDQLVRRSKSQLEAIQPDQGDILAKLMESTTDFEDNAPELVENLAQFAATGDTSLPDARIFAWEPATTYGSNGGSHRVLHDVGIYTGSGNALPDAGIRATLPWYEGDCLRPSDAEGATLDSNYNWYFRSCRHRNKEGNLTNDCLLNQIAETVFAALHTRSGWYCLYRCTEAVFLRVESTPARSSRWLTVYVSSIYRPTGVTSILDGLLAMFQACKVANDAKMQQLSDIATSLMISTARKLGRHEQSTSGDRSNTRPASNELLNDLALTASDRAELQSAVRGEKLLVLDRRDIIRFFLLNCRGNLGFGVSGYVVHSRVDGVDLAVKRWNKFDSDIQNSMIGLSNLQYEIQIYAYLHKYHPQVLGRILPRPIAIFTETSDEWVEYTLVTQMVGHEIVKTEECVNTKGKVAREVWTVNEERLSERDIEEIKAASKKISEQLKGLGVFDFDVSSHNFRVERIKDGRDKWKWHVWKIDLGRCLIFREGREVDLKALKSLVERNVPRRSQ